MTQSDAGKRCVCMLRGYCADVRDDPLSCPVCVELGPDDDCPTELLWAARAEAGPA